MSWNKIKKLMKRTSKKQQEDNELADRLRRYEIFGEPHPFFLELAETHPEIVKQSLDSIEQRQLENLRNHFSSKRGADK